MIQPYSDEYFMKRALEQAQIAFESGEVPVGAIVVANNRIIAKAHNQTELLTDVTAHAEILALTSASANLGGKYLKRCTLYVTLEPCSHYGQTPPCVKNMIKKKLHKVVFPINDSDERSKNIAYKKLTNSKIKVQRFTLKKFAKIFYESYFLQSIA